MLVIIVLSIFSLSLMHLSIASLKEAIGKCIQKNNGQQCWPLLLTS